MAEEKTHGVQNKWLLLIAIVLGLMTVFIYQGHIKAIRAEQEGQKIAIIEITKGPPAGREGHGAPHQEDGDPEAPGQGSGQRDELGQGQVAGAEQAG